MKRFIVMLVAIMTTSVVFGQAFPAKGSHARFVNPSELDRGFWAGVDALCGTSLMQKSDNYFTTGLEVTGGYRFSEFAKVGAGFGAAYFSNSKVVMKDEQAVYYSAFLQGRGNFITGLYRAVTPCWEVQAGYVFKAGAMFDVGVGFRAGGKRHAFVLTLAYAFQQCPSNPHSGILLKLGYEF